MEIELTDGEQPGCTLLKLSRPTGEKLHEDSWCVALSGSRERKLGSFNSGTRAFVKAAALANSTTSPQYSGVKSRIVQ